MMIGTRKLDSFDPEAMEETVKGAAFQHVQLGRGRFLGRLLSVQAHRYRLDHGHYNLPLHVRGSMPNDHVTLGFLMGGAGTSNFNAHVIERPVPVMLRAGTELDFRMAPQSEWLSLQVKGSELEQLGISPEHYPDGPAGHPGSSGPEIRQSLRRAVISLLGMVEGETSVVAPENYCEKVLASVFDDFVAILQRDDGPAVGTPQHPAQARQLVRSAIDYMHEHCGGALQIGLMCEELGTSWKTLERAFLRVHGLTPKQYLGYARLAKARRFLLRSGKTGESIAEVATSCGIHHLGRFAQLYRATYGELPSTTVGKWSA